MSDVMLYGVLRMPYEMAMGSELSRYQFYQRVQEAANRLEAAEAELVAAEAQPAQQTPEYGRVEVVGDLVRNLLTLDQATPIYAAFHVDYQGNRACRTRPVWTSRERVIDGKWVDSKRTDVPYSVIVWAKPQADDKAQSSPTEAQGNSSKNSSSSNSPEIEGIARQNFNQWFEREYPRDGDRRPKYQQSGVMDLMRAAWSAARSEPANAGTAAEGADGARLETNSSDASTMKEN